MNPLLTTLLFLLFTSHAYAGLVSPFMRPEAGELNAVVETENQLFVVDLSYEKLRAHVENPYVVHIFEKASRTWSTIDSAESKMYADGGSRDIRFRTPSQTVEIYLPSSFNKLQHNEVAKCEMNASEARIVRYGAVYIGMKDVIPVILPLYSPADQAEIVTTGELRDDASPNSTKKGFLKKTIGRFWKTSGLNPLVKSEPDFKSSRVMQCKEIYP